MSGLIEEKVEKLKRIAQKLESEDSTMEDLEEASSVLTEELGSSPYLDYVNAIIFINSQEIDRAEVALLKSLDKFRFFHITYFLLLQIYQAAGEVEKVFKYYTNAVRYADTEEEKAPVIQFLKDYIDELARQKDSYFMANAKNFLEIMKDAQSPADYTDFPLDTKKKSLLRKRLFEERTDELYFMNLYKMNGIGDIDESISSIVKTEMLRGQFVEGETVVEKNPHDMIAVSAMSNELLSLDITLKDRVVKKKSLRYSRFYYFNIPEDGPVKLSSDKKFFLSHIKHRSLPDKPRLVLNIFVDSCSFDFIKKEGFEELMPNTYDFFKEGFIANDCHSTGEWTHPSVMSISTGKYTTNHNNFHGKGDYEPELYSKLLQEHFSEAGYYVTRICNNWRLTPNMGYYKKTDRFMYCPMAERMYAEEMVMDAVEHLESFKHFSNYLWLTVEDLHEASEGVETGLLASVLEDRFADGGERTYEPSVQQKYSEDKINHYRAKIKRVDFYLGLLYRYLTKNYETDEMLVCLFSDHGMGFLSKDETMFINERSNVPLLLRGRGVKPLISEELVSTIDIYPTLLRLCGIDSKERIDGRLMFDFGGIKRDFVYTESIFPGQTYKAAIRDSEHEFHFEAGELTSTAGFVDLSSYKARLVDRITKKEVTQEQEEKVRYYLCVVYEHIKNWLKFW